MKVNFYFRSIPKRQQQKIKPFVKQWAEAHMAPRLSWMDTINTKLGVTLIADPDNEEHYTAKLHLHLPRKKMLVATAGADDLKSAIEQAQTSLIHEIHHHIDRLCQHAEHKRKVRQQHLHELKKQLAVLPSTTLEQAETGIEPLLPCLGRVARRELAYLRNSGEVTGDYPTVQDVVDEAVAALKTDWRRGDEQAQLLRRLLREVFRALDRETEAARQYGELVSLDMAPDEDPEYQAEAMIQEEFYEYYQPDDVIRLIDVLPDERILPTEFDEGSEQHRYTLQRMSDLPISWRRALMLFEFEQLTVADIAAILDVELAKVQRWLEQANDFLYAHLEQAGFCLEDERPLMSTPGCKS